MHTESPYQDDEQLIRAAHADVNLLNDPVNIAAYQALGIPAAYMPHALPPAAPLPAGGWRTVTWSTTWRSSAPGSRPGSSSSSRWTSPAWTCASPGPWLTLPEDSPLRDWTATDLDDCVDNEQARADIYRRSAHAGSTFTAAKPSEAHDGQGLGVRAPGDRDGGHAACGLPGTRAPSPTRLFPMLPAYTVPGRGGGPDPVGPRPPRRPRRSARRKPGLPWPGGHSQAMPGSSWRCSITGRREQWHGHMAGTARSTSA